MKRIAVTGTKGKTTVVNVLADILRNQQLDVLHVDTSGHFFNGERRSVASDSYDIWGIRTVTAAPGRYLSELSLSPNEKRVAVLECSFSCSKRGLGYDRHSVGVFLNVFDDHINPDGAVKSKQELAEAKSFVFSALEADGYAVFNADDAYVCAMLDKLPDQDPKRLIPCGLEFSNFDVAQHLERGGVAFTVKGGNVVLYAKDHEIALCDISRVSWTFEGTFTPSVMNLIHVCGALYGLYDGMPPKEIASIIERSRLPEQTGRLVVMKAESGATIIADYAHEKESLRAIASLGRKYITEPNGELWGVVRLSHERTDEHIRAVGESVGSDFDQVVVYDKIDGHFRKPKPPFVDHYPQLIGGVSEKLAVAVKTKNQHVQRIIREDEAIAHAAANAKASDVVVVILNDDVERSLGFVKQKFKAEVV